MSQSTNRQVVRHDPTTANSTLEPYRATPRLPEVDSEFPRRTTMRTAAPYVSASTSARSCARPEARLLRSRA
jgi:hypothetical protein